ncbi:TIGR00730 family Rossman fold protein [Flavimarina sp. Hel_I_48]|uniref:LOG family protein n=1 Tax=Flavimarina sp. Hel_I_48 TaxID=1392488 RepID=UPI0004DED63B|nr:TIGR00730 family Rossman fold protein [Flavimarina sp. Hel_I_48]
MNKIESICVFCGSSEGKDAAIIEQATQLGKTLAKRKITLVYGASKIGIMGKVAHASLENGGKVVGIIPEFLKLKEIVHLGLDELITTKNMHDRKMLMQERSDAFIALPGGFGTLEELFEIITWSQLGLHHKPIGLLNTSGFYDHLIALLKEMVRQGFLKTANMELLIVDEDIESLLHKMETFEPTIEAKWLKLEQT